MADHPGPTADVALGHRPGRGARGISAFVVFWLRREGGGRLVIARSVVPGEITVLREMTAIEQAREGWCFVCWRTAPGPGPDDVAHEVPDLQEAVAVGTCSLLRSDDYVFGGHRSHAHAIAKGADINRLMAEIAGRVCLALAGRDGRRLGRDALLKARRS